MRVADYIFKYLADYGVEHVFCIVGGGAMFLNDGLRKQEKIKYLCNHHEQGSAIAAEGYARATGKLGVVSVTSGPGGTNAMTGVIGQWLDSVPVLYLSGQVKFETTTASCPDSQLRQLGDQEINIVDMVKPVTKYAKMITDPKTIKQELHKAITIATSGRPGPVWLDIPLNVQGAPINIDELLDEDCSFETPKLEKASIDNAIDLLQSAKRPVFIAGHGIRLADAKDQFVSLVKKTNIPTVTTFNGFDLLPTEDKNFIGRIGTLGSRAGNYALQNADLIFCLGTRNNIRQVSYNWESFGKNAKKILIDVDNAELHKKTVQGDLCINCDANDFIEGMLELLPDNYRSDESWLDWCLVRKKKYPVVLDEYKVPNEKSVHPYHFVEELTSSLDEDSVVVAGNGTACVVLFQAGVVKEGQRIFWNSGCASMGYALPAAFGAAFSKHKNVVCLTGDGSLQMNIQELEAIRYSKLPVKIFLMNNQGYRSIEQTQNSFFCGEYIGCNTESGVSFPDNEKLAELYGFKYFRIDSTEKMNQRINEALEYDGMAFCEVIHDNKYIFSPKLSSKKLPDGKMVSSPLEDLYPFLDRDEHESNMIND